MKFVLDHCNYLHGESLKMVDRLEALGGEVLNEVLTAQTGKKTAWGEKQGCLDCHQTTATRLKVGPIFKKQLHSH